MNERKGDIVLQENYNEQEKGKTKQNKKIEKAAFFSYLQHAHKH